MARTAQTPRPPVAPTVCRILLPFALGHFLSYLFRSINAVIAADLQHDVGLTASELGLLTASYLFAFAIVQLPLGLLLDRTGPRRAEAVLLMIAGAGSLVFAAGQEMASLTLGRVLIGLGVSACLMASIKAFSIWFQEDQLPTLNGYLFAFGGLGALMATAPVDMLLSITTWRMVFVGLACLCVLVSLTILFIVPEHNSTATRHPLGKELSELFVILRSRQLWRFTPAAMFFPGAIMAVQGLWAGPWLRHVQGFDDSSTALFLFLLALATTLGFAVWGLLISRLTRLGFDSIHVIAVGLLFFSTSLGVLAWQPSLGNVVTWLLLGFFSSAGAMLYATFASQFKKNLTGRAITSLNLMVFIGAFLLQWGIGIIVELTTQLSVSSDPTFGYRFAFGLIVALQVVALLILLWPVRHQQQTDRSIASDRD